MFVTELVPAYPNAIVDVGTFCQVLNAAVIPSIARCSVSGDTPPAQVGLPLLQLLMIPWSLIFHGIGTARGLQTASAILVPPLTIASRLPPARVGEPIAANPRMRGTKNAAGRGRSRRRRADGRDARGFLKALPTSGPASGRPGVCE